MNCFTLKFSFPYNKTTESNKKKVHRVNKQPKQNTYNMK